MVLYIYDTVSIVVIVVLFMVHHKLGSVTSHRLGSVTSHRLGSVTPH